MFSGTKEKFALHHSCGTDILNVRKKAWNAKNATEYMQHFLNNNTENDI
jgi:hypothetical protein